MTAQQKPNACRLKSYSFRGSLGSAANFTEFHLVFSGHSLVHMTGDLDASICLRFKSSVAARNSERLLKWLGDAMYWNATSVEKPEGLHEVLGFLYEDHLADAWSSIESCNIYGISFTDNRSIRLLNGAFLSNSELILDEYAQFTLSDITLGNCTLKRTVDFEGASSRNQVVFERCSMNGGRIYGTWRRCAFVDLKASGVLLGAGCDLRGSEFVRLRLDERSLANIGGSLVFESAKSERYGSIRDRLFELLAGSLLDRRTFSDPWIRAAVFGSGHIRFDGWRRYSGRFRWLNPKYPRIGAKDSLKKKNIVGADYTNLLIEVPLAGGGMDFLLARDLVSRERDGGAKKRIADYFSGAEIDLSTKFDPPVRTFVFESLGLDRSIKCIIGRERVRPNESIIGRSYSDLHVETGGVRNEEKTYRADWLLRSEGELKSEADDILNDFFRGILFDETTVLDEEVRIWMLKNSRTKRTS